MQNLVQGIDTEKLKGDINQEIFFFKVLLPYFLPFFTTLETIGQVAEGVANLGNHAQDAGISIQPAEMLDKLLGLDEQDSKNLANSASFDTQEAFHQEDLTDNLALTIANKGKFS